MDLRMICAPLLLATAACGEPALPAPPAGLLDSAAARERGRTAYLEHCALCHGVDANGHGVREQALSGPPADVTLPSWRQSTSPGEVFTVVRDGVRGTSMPSWRSLSEAETWDLVAYLWSVGEAVP
jgi:mono/diheme cytochrome c family protein